MFTTNNYYNVPKELLDEVIVSLAPSISSLSLFTEKKHTAIKICIYRSIIK